MRACVCDSQGEKSDGYPRSDPVGKETDVDSLVEKK